MCVQCSSFVASFLTHPHAHSRSLFAFCSRLDPPTTHPYLTPLLFPLVRLRQPIAKLIASRCGSGSASRTREK
ncbi:hypothetical protein BCR44DRAFT_1435930 [Catenaria anguillulae PL171]|uniref:Uncharacterized protein n=1 Tax=Catenaria anguillulae PL171 TaxID=765915 RepID=A0A1Y2HN44_9FUNG|nr:hypothetical protein BCR44DRAFT_1435930 [Catenaria anguillulae PL171]